MANLSEFDIIKQYFSFSRYGRHRSQGVLLGVGDDAGGIDEDDEFDDEDAGVLGRGEAPIDSAEDDDDLVMEEALAAVMQKG